MRQRGFTYLAILFGVAILGAVLAAIGIVWRTAVLREKEAELLFIGHAYRDAIVAYHEQSPGTDKKFPTKLEDLLEDKRQIKLTRHLRKLYRDPMTGGAEWGVITEPASQGIIGVYSLSMQTPIKRQRFDENDKGFQDAASYRDWRFIYTPPAVPTTPNPATQPPPTGPGAKPPAGQPPKGQTGQPLTVQTGTAPGSTPAPGQPPSGQTPGATRSLPGATPDPNGVPVETPPTAPPATESPAPETPAPDPSAAPPAPPPEENGAAPSGANPN